MWHTKNSNTGCWTLTVSDKSVLSKIASPLITSSLEGDLVANLKKKGINTTKPNFLYKQKHKNVQSIQRATISHLHTLQPEVLK